MHPKISGRILCSLFAVLLQPAAFSQAPTPDTAQGLGEHTNSLGMRFLPVSSLPIAVSEFETTKTTFEKFVAGAGHQWDPKVHFEQTPNDPAVGVTRADAQAFCEWLTKKERSEGKITETQIYRLPSNAEWTAAVGLTGGSLSGPTTDERLEGGRVYPWGEQWPPPEGAGNIASTEIEGYDEPFPFTSPVGKFTPNKFGLYDMAGNAWEWCSDQGVESPQNGILRGGSWVYFRPEYLLAAYQYEVPVDLRAPTFGFRCVFEDTETSKNVYAQNSADVASKVEEKNQTLLSNQQGGNDDDLAAAKNRLLPSRDSKDLDAAKSRLLPGRDNTDSGRDFKLITGVTPPSGVSPHQNMLGMQFTPLTGGNLLATNETMIRAFDHYIQQTSSSWPKRPSFSQKPTHPAAGVTWDQADAFCRWLTDFEQKRGALSPSQFYRLPTDAEWSLAAGLQAETGATPQEKAQSANSGVYTWGTAWPPPPFAGNFDASKIDSFKDRFSYTSPVGQSNKSGAGFFDLAGNVSEWCADVWEGNSRVLRGSSWLDSAPEALASGHRKSLDSASTRPDIGFRCLLQTQ